MSVLTAVANTATTSVGQVLAHGGPGGWGGGPGGPGGWGGGGPGIWWPIFPIFWALVWAGIITAAVLFFRRRRRWLASAPRRSAESVLADRYARGEIDDTEYHHRLETLRAEGSGGGGGFDKPATSPPKS